MLERLIYIPAELASIFPNLPKLLGAISSHLGQAWKVALNKLRFKSMIPDGNIAYVDALLADGDARDLDFAVLRIALEKIGRNVGVFSDRIHIASEYIINQKLSELDLYHIYCLKEKSNSHWVAKIWN